MKLTIKINSEADAIRAVNLLQGYMVDTPTPAPAEEPVVEVEEPAPVSEPDTAAIEAAGVDLDVNGTPWIEEVHATTKTKTKDGKWKKKRGVDDDEVEAAEAKARAKIATTPVTLVPPVETVAEIIDAAPQPVPTISLEEVTAKWVECMERGLVSVEAAPELYAQLGIDGSQLTVNETARATLYNHLSGLLDAPAQPGLPQ